MKGTVDSNVISAEESKYEMDFSLSIVVETVERVWRGTIVV